MEILRNIDELKAFLDANKGKEIGFVPTMGFLHNGHAKLIEQASYENEISIVSVFVNPTQFLPNEDYEKYPRDEKHDIAMANGCKATAIFLPSPSDIYFDDDIKVMAPACMASILEGATRPGHFDGVCSVIAKFLCLIKPTRAYFGKKDTQQLLIIQKLVKSLFLDTQIIPCEIVRSGDGLALSSRNSYLNETELMDACKLYRSLVKAKNMFASGISDAKQIRLEMEKILEPLKIDYIAICDRQLNEIDHLVENSSIILIAAYVGKTRLIDNLWI